MEKNCHFPIWKSLEKVFLSVSMEKENNFPFFSDLVFWYTFS